MLSATSMPHYNDVSTNNRSSFQDSKIDLNKNDLTQSDLIKLMDLAAQTKDKSQEKWKKKFSKRNSSL